MNEVIWLTQLSFPALIDTLVERIEALLDEPHGTRIALAGGRTPRALLQQLRASGAPLHTLTLVPTDERWVSVHDAQSNEGMFRRELVAPLEAALQPRLVSLKTTAATPAEAVSEVARRLDLAVPGDFELTLLGMGADGHVASLFPGPPMTLGAIGDAPPRNTRGRARRWTSASCIAAVQPETGQPRLSLSLSRLLRTRALALLINGADKRRVLQAALADPIGELPVAQLLRSAQARGLNPAVYWTADESMELA